MNWEYQENLDRFYIPQKYLSYSNDMAFIDITDPKIEGKNWFKNTFKLKMSKTARPKRKEGNCKNKQYKRHTNRLSQLLKI